MTVDPHTILLSSGKTLWKALQEHRNWFENNFYDVQTRLVLTSETLDNVDFTGYTLSGAKFSSCSMKGCVFGFDMIHDVLFTSTDLTGAVFRGNVLSYIRFRSCDLTNAIFNGVEFRACSDYQSNKTSTNFSFCKIAEYSMLFTSTDSPDVRGYLAVWTGTGVEPNASKTAFASSGQLPPARDVSDAPADMQ